MGFYSIYKIFKDMLRTLFGKHFLKFIIILVFVFIGYIIFSSEGVFAATSDVVVDSSMFNDTVVNDAKTRIGENIWNNTDYDIWLCFWGQVYRNSGQQDYKYGYTYSYFNTVDYSNIDSLKLSTINTNYTFYNKTFVNSSIIAKDSNNNNTSFLKYWSNIYGNNIIGSSSDSGVTLSGVCSMEVGSRVLWFKCIRSHYDLYDDNGNLLLAKNYIENIDPFITNNSQEIENWSFDKLSINLGTYDPYYTYIDFRTLKTFDLIYTYKDTNYTINVDNYLHQVSGEYFIDIPVNALTNSVNIRNDSEISFTLSAGGRFIETDYFELGTYSLVLTSEEQEQINQDSEKYVQSQILQEQQKTNENLNNINNNINNTNEKLDNLDNTINNSNVDNITSDTLPSDNTQDITADGVNGIFTSIYNAFCSGNAQDIVFPIPFTDKNITLSANYVSNALNSSGAGFIVTLIQAFWWYLISRFIIKDIMNKINKIKSGNIEDIETTNIRGDML